MGEVSEHLISLQTSEFDLSDDAHINECFFLKNCPNRFYCFLKFCIAQYVLKTKILVYTKIAS